VFRFQMSARRAIFEFVWNRILIAASNAELVIALARSHVKSLDFLALHLRVPPAKLSMTAAFNASLYSRLQLLEHENRAQNQAITRLQFQNERLSLALSRLHSVKTFGDETSSKAIANHHRHSITVSSGYEPNIRKESIGQRSSRGYDVPQSQKQNLTIKLPSALSNSAAFDNALKIASSINPMAAPCPHGPACRKEFCDLAHSAFFCCAHGVHCMRPAACGIMSLSRARRLHEAHLHEHPPAACAIDTSAADQLFCVWMHAHCDKFQPRSDHLCPSGFREVRVLSDARHPQRCRSWALIRNVRCFFGRENRGSGCSAGMLRRAVERQLPGLLLNLAADSFVFTSAASALEALQLMISDTDSPASMIHVL
jgi:hypothetical protein